MKTKATFSVLALLAIAFTLIPNPCLSAVPGMINYQGVLKDSTGVPYHGPATMIFSIWDDSTEGNKLWEETHPVVEVTHGLFNVLLGSVDNPIPDSVFNQPNAWLDVLANGSQLSPRGRMVSVGYAFRSELTDTAEYARSAPRDDDWTPDTAGFNIYRLTGNVGIGTTTPDRQLDIAGHSGRLRVLGRESIAEAVLETLGAGGVQWQLKTGNNASSMNGRFSLLGGPGEWLTVLPGGYVGIGTADPQERLDIEGNVEAYAFNVGDIFFQKDEEKLWRMFEDEEGLYLENLKTGKVYRFVLQEVEEK